MKKIINKINCGQSLLFKKNRWEERKTSKRANVTMSATRERDVRAAIPPPAIGEGNTSFPRKLLGKTQNKRENVTVTVNHSHTTSQISKHCDSFPTYKISFIFIITIN